MNDVILSEGWSKPKDDEHYTNLSYDEFIKEGGGEAIAYLAN